MSLSDRLKQAEQERSPTRPPTGDAGTVGSAPVGPVIDLTRASGPVLDLTDRSTAPIELFGVGDPTGTSPTPAVSFIPLRADDLTSDFDDIDPRVANQAATPCPRCSGPTHVDMFDQVQQTASLSCLSCFHMFRVAV
jgi:hypothetical protein